MSVRRMVRFIVEFPCHRVRFGFLHSERLGPLETFDLNEKLGHLHDLNDTHDLNVTSMWPQRPHNDLTVTSMEVMSWQKMTEFDDFNLLNDLNEE